VVRTLARVDLRCLFYAWEFKAIPSDQIDSKLMIGLRQKGFNQNSSDFDSIAIKNSLCNINLIFALSI
jgi:hypothetical protein